MGDPRRPVAVEGHAAPPEERGHPRTAARHMALLWLGADTPTQDYHHLTEEDMPGIQRCFLSTLDYLQQTHPHVLELRWTPPG